MKTFYFNLTYFVLAAVLTIGFSTVSIAQTTCTQNDPLVCATLTPNVGTTFTGGPNTTVTPIGVSTIFTATATAVTPTTISMTSNTMVVTGTDGCVLVKFAIAGAGTATVTSTDVNINTSGGLVTCTGVTLTGGTACIRICDPRITSGSTISVRLDFNLAVGTLTGSTVIVSDFATAFPLETVPCASNFVCINDGANCTSCDPALFPIFNSKIRVFFSSPILAGTPNPVITSVVGATGTLLNQFKLCAAADAATNISRTFVDYCVYSNVASLPIATFGPLLGITFQGNTLPCVVTLLASTPCPTTFALIPGTTGCAAPCDANFTTLRGKIRLFFPTPIAADVPNPAITSVLGLQATAGTIKLCAATDAATNVERTFVDYCIYTNAIGATLPLLITGPLTIGVQLPDCTTPTILCVVAPTVTPPCPFSSFVVINNGTAGGAGGGTAETCAATTNCNGSLVYFASRLRVNLTTCLLPGVPAPTISGAQMANALGTLIVLGNSYCFVESAESEALIGTTRCFIEYCVYSTLQNDRFFVNPPVSLQFNIVTNILINGILTPVLQNCLAAPDSDNDGVPDAIDVDDDNDGIPDRYEFATGKNGGFTPTNDPSADDDGDGIPNYRDPSNPQCGGLNANGVCINYDTDGDGIPNHLDLDSDNDGLPDVIEAGGADANGDGRLDCSGTCDADGDGLLASVDINDASTATYATSANISELAIAPNTYVYGGNFYNGVLDTDYDTVPDFLDIDSDNDGIYDIIETGGADANGDGRVDSFADADNDGLSTQYDADVNNDGDVTDTGEGTQKALIISNASNTDGTAESWTDGPDPDKFPVDFDSDILPNYRDLESDSDGINDVLEAGGSDPDGNGIIGTGPSNAALVNNDGYATALTSPLISTDADATGDGRPNDDADPELSPYFNGGGATPYGGSSTSPLNFRPDQDSDTRPNFLDLDSDNDGINDIIENIGVPATTIDADNDGLIDVALRVDTDFDGIADGGGIDGAVGTFGDAANVPPVNTDADNVPDYLDLDSDNDGLFDVSEGGNPALDANGDGIVDCNVPGSFEACDPDLDGIMASVDGQPAVIGDAASPTPPDADSDGIPDYRELDSDNNGTFDHTQNGALGPDTNNDGIVDGSDTDFDGIINPAGFPDDNQVFGGNTGLGAPLPVTLVEFKARQNQQNVTVSWITLQEINLSRFEVMRSLDGINYVTIGTVNATGGSLGTNYQFIDIAPVKGNNYYRLKSVDNDASFKYSAIAVVKLADKNNFLITVSPNPVVNQYNVRLAGLEKGAYRIELFNSLGQLQMTKKIIITEFDHVENMQRKSSSDGGLYWLNIVNEKTNSTIKTMRIFMLQE